MAEKILVVDDDLETLVLIGKMLQGHGYTILAANNGSQALAMAHKEIPDLIVLDIMMPDMDGYQVTQEIRKDVEIGDIPIIMFTAKSQVDDKVSGYEAGADDYLTKPVHPIELVAHVRSLLARTKAKPVPAEAPVPTRKNYTIGVVSAKGGLGVSTLVLNLAASFAHLTKADVIAAELRPGQGTWVNDLGLSSSGMLEDLLSMEKSKINPPAVEARLTGTSFGIRILQASNQINAIDYTTLGEKLVEIVDGLSRLSEVLFLDIGTPFFPGFEKICSRCKEILVVTDAMPTTAKRTRILIEEINAMTSSVSKNFDLVLYKHARSDLQLTAEQIAKMIPGYQVKAMIPPAPEQMYQAIQKQIPMFVLHPDSLFAQQINELAKMIHSKGG